MKRIILPTFFLLTSYNILAQQKVGIGTNTPTEKLEVAGNIKADTVKPNALKLTTNAGQGKVLMSDAAGNANWNTNIGSAPVSNIGYGVWGDCATNGNISEYQPLTDTAVNTGEVFGWAVDVSGDFAIVGIPQKTVAGNLYQGSANMYQFNGTNWEFMQTISDGTNANGYFGQAVSISGNYAIVGVPQATVGTNAAQGAACIYQYNGSKWVFMQRISNTAGATGDKFGASVSISGNLAIVGALSDKINANLGQGAATIYKYNGTSWLQQQYLYETTGANADDNFGSSVSISGNYAVVGIPQANPTGYLDWGAANIYQYNGSNWVLLQKIFSPVGGETGDYFGNAVSISDNYLIIGSKYDQINAKMQGSASIYQFKGGSWVWMETITSAVAVGVSNLFGASVSISDNYAIVGANNYFSNKIGAAYIYLRVGQGWQKLQTITDPGGDIDGFGSSAGMDAATKRFLIGAPAFGGANIGKVVFGKIN